MTLRLPVTPHQETVRCATPPPLPSPFKNPAVSLTMALRKELEWSMLAPYWFAQFIGAFVASAVMFLNYSAAMYHYARHCCADTDSPFGDGCREDTAHAWTSFPQRYESVGYGFVDQMVGTAVLLGGICAIIDAEQRRPSPPAGPFTVAASVGVFNFGRHLQLSVFARFYLRSTSNPRRVGRRDRHVHGVQRRYVL